MKVKVMISNRHVHLTKEDYEMLFDEEINVHRKLNQIGEFASDKFVNIKNGNNIIKKVRVVGPFRSYTQVELARSDARTLKMDVNVAKSGVLDNASEIVIYTDKGEIKRKSAIIADRHLHINTKDKDKYGFEDGDKINIYVDGKKGGVMNAFVRISDSGYFEVHIDKDDASSFILNNNDIVRIEKSEN